MDSLALDRILKGEESVPKHMQHLLDELLVQTDHACIVIEKLGDEGRIYAYTFAPYASVLAKHKLHCAGCSALVEASWDMHLGALDELGVLA